MSMNNPKFDNAAVYMNKKLQGKKRDEQGKLVPLTLGDIDVTAWMCGWDACLRWVGE